MPLAGILWDDELPDDLMTIPESERIQIFRLFDIRSRIWKSEPLPEADQQLWETARAMAPGWPLFQRLQASADDLLAQEQAKAKTLEALEAMFAVADKVDISEKAGAQELTATFDLTKKQPARRMIKSWWEQILRHVFRAQDL